MKPARNTSGALVNDILPVHSREPSHLRFLDEAAVATQERLTDTVARIRAGRLGRGLWHPTGFATFEVSQVPSLGLVRVHFWPAGLRRGLPRHPPIHQHCFRLFSLVLAGEYRESQYRVLGPVPDGPHQAPADARRMRTYEVRATEMGKDELHETCEDLYVVPTCRAVRFPAGSWHEVPVHTFHATPIPGHRFCATLAVLSLPVPGAGDVLLGHPGSGSSVNTRQVVNAEEQDLMSRQFLDAWDSR